MYITFKEIFLRKDFIREEKHVKKNVKKNVKKRIMFPPLKYLSLATIFTSA